MIARIKAGFSRVKAKSSGASFRKRYAEVEARRGAMLGRLDKMNGDARAHPAYKRALSLLNERFRQAKVAQRVAILQAAEWLIDVLEALTLIA